MDLELAGKVVLITGGSDGLGLALAERLVAEGARTAFCGRDHDRVRGIESRLAAAGGEIIGVVADVTIPDDIERFASTVIERWGKSVDGLVNNAGTAPPAGTRRRRSPTRSGSTTSTSR